MDKEYMINDVEYISLLAATAFRNGNEDECYNQLLNLIDVATQLMESLNLTYE